MVKYVTDAFYIRIVAEYIFANANFQKQELQFQAF